LFSNFILQTSPKNSYLFRIRKTYLGHLLSKTNTIEIDVPYQLSEYAGIRKNDKIILVEIENSTPKWVWKKEKNYIWKKEIFLGYQIISKFSLKEFESQKKIIKKALSEHWANLNKSSSNIHGDFTHFNILYDENEKIHLIDKKEMVNSKLFDFYYFYSYLKQSINLSTSISEKEKRKIFEILNELITKTCIYKKRSDFLKDFNKIIIPSNGGLKKNRVKNYLTDFYNMFDRIV
jgi:tRNA A-37 threonylcarbamoyl transferase component Bud32